MKNRVDIVEEQRLYLSFLPHVRYQFGSLPGVIRIGLGAREKGGRLLEEWAVRFYVSKKRRLQEVPESERIPKRLFGVKTDVIEHFEQVSFILTP